jgi:glycosyltransferase involved in cell wall biosynthesis
MNPLVSVIIPVYNVQDYVMQCLQSIINQTYSNLEIWIVNDASTDHTEEIISYIKDSRIQIINNDCNLGLAESVNRSISESTGKYIARMDADDVALPTRIERQVDYLERNPDVDILGTAMQSFGYSRYTHYFPSSHDRCKAQLLFNVCFGHPTVMMRSEIFSNKGNLYRSELRQYSEEYELWCRLVDDYKFCNLPDVLLRYRTFPPSAKVDADEKRKKNSFIIRSNFIESQFGYHDSSGWKFHDFISRLERAQSPEILQVWIDWLLTLEKLNNQKQVFETDALRYELSKRLFELLYHNTQFRFSSLFAWYSHHHLRNFSPSIFQHLKFCIRALAGS